AVDGGLTRGEDGQRRAVGDRRVEVGAHHRGQDAAAAVAGPHGDGVDHQRVDKTCAVVEGEGGTHERTHRPSALQTGTLGGDHAQGGPVGAARPAVDPEALGAGALVEEPEPEDVQV